MKKEYKVKVFTGIRPTGSLTVANYLGAVEPILNLTKKGIEPMVFVADLHAITDEEPSVVQKFINEVVVDYLALGLDPEKSVIFIQSTIKSQVFTLMSYLTRHITVAELLRVPTLKDKLKNKRGETANSFLFLYPVLMAADILIQRAEQVPVGKDQESHLEISRLLARRFNDCYGNIFPIPKPYEIEALKILSLKGEGKMSKSIPDGAIFLNDDIKSVTKKIKGAITSIEGKMTEGLESNILLAKGLAKREEDKVAIDKVVSEHMAGKKVMGEFKNILVKIVSEFLTDFQEKRERIINNKGLIKSVLEKGTKIATENANKTMAIVEKAMFK